MGACQSMFPNEELREQIKVNKQIERALVKPKGGMLEQHVLLLGPGESGKSTVMKQMKAMSGAYSKEDLKAMKKLMFQNLHMFSNELINQVSFYSLQHDVREELIESFRKMVDDLRIAGENMNGLDNELAERIKAFWSHRAIQETFENRDKFHLTESAAYLFANIDRIKSRDFEPTMQDIFHTRKPTVGVNREEVVLKNIKLIVCDCGGQRSERRKWFHLFTDNHAVLFVAAISEYDQVIVENEQTNRIDEAVNLFGVVFNGKYFNKSSIILFLNKFDIFEEKVKRVPIKNYFDTFEGENNATNGARFFRRRFMKKLKEESIKKRVYIHETCAISDQVQLVINTVIDTVVQENLKDTGMI